MKPFPVTVTIATAGRADCLLRTLDSLARVDDVRRIDRVIVTENGDHSELEGRLDAVDLPLEYRFVPLNNKSAALNDSLSRTRDGLVLFLDDDVQLQRSWLTAYLAAAEQHRTGTYFGGAFRVRYQTPPREGLLPYMTGSTKDWTLGQKNRRLPRGAYVFGFNWAAWRCDLDAIGGFDTRFGPGATTGATGQESEAQRRLRRRGCRGMFVAGAEVEHRVENVQVTEEWILGRRRRAGRELGIVIGQAVRLPLVGVAIRSAVLIQRARFARQHRPPAAMRTFHHRWWKEYLQGALESVHPSGPSMNADR